MKPELNIVRGMALLKSEEYCGWERKRGGTSGEIRYLDADLSIMERY